MKLKKQKTTPLDRVCKILDDEKLIYVRAKLVLKDGETKENIETVAVMVGAVFLKKTGEYMFAAPIANPLPRNHTPT